MLRAHTRGPQRRRDLHQAVRFFPEATIRDAVTNLCELGALKREGEASTRFAPATSLTPTGEEMLAAADALESWLGRCPTGPIELVGSGAKVAVKALAESWSSNLIRELAIAPRTLTELSGLVPWISYPAVERRISWMRQTGKVVPLPDEDRRARYVPTDWLRLAAAPLAIASRCERRCTEDARPITEAEVEALVLLALPLVTRGPTENGSNVAGPSDDTFAIGSPEAWLDAVIEGRFGRLRTGGADHRLARDIHLGLFVHR